MKKKQNLKQITMDIWRYRMSDNSTTDEIKDRYRDAIKWLTKVSEGKIKLAAATTNESAVTLPMSVSIERG